MLHRKSLYFLLKSAGLALCLTIVQTSVATAQIETNPLLKKSSVAGDSVYQLNANMTDQNGRDFKLNERRGQPVIVSMFYNSCTFVCPMLIDTMRLTEQSLSPDERAQLKLLLITFDPQRDQVKDLKFIAEKRELNTAHWTLARTEASSTRKIAAMLGIQYRLLADGDYNHTTILILLDREGKPVARTKKMGTLDPDFIQKVKQTMHAVN